VTGLGRQSGGVKDRGREWIRMGRKHSWAKNNHLHHKKEEESERGKNRDKKTVMVKLIIQKIKGTTTTKISVSLAKLLDLFLWCLTLTLALCILGCVGKVVPLLLESLEGRQLKVLFCFFLLSMVLCAICYKCEF
jgi:hypothetical protein